jgi:hypothetical protein
MVNRVLRETSTLRGLPIKRPVKSGVRSRAAVEQMVTRLLKEENSSNEIAASELVLKQLGMAPANFNMRSYYVQLLGEQIAGYYDPKSKTFYTTPQVNRLELETVMAHELTHALQDQHFNLVRLKAGKEHNADAQMALSSLIEGDATLAMSRYAMSNPLRAFGVLLSPFVSTHNTAVLQAGPRALRESLTFPYIQGAQFATSLYRLGGWPKVTAAFKDVPLSTEQILHVEKYFLSENPIPVPLRDVSPVLGQGWTLLDYDVNGEYGQQLELAEYAKTPDEAARAAAGWGGDCMAVYRGPKNAALVVQDTVWDNDKEALEWAQAYAKRSTTRLGVTPQSRGALQVWNGTRKGKPNGVWMERRGRRVLILEGGVGAFNPAPVLANLWRPNAAPANAIPVRQN